MSHLKDTTYLKHMKVALMLSWNMLLLAIVGVIHAVFPFAFPNLLSSRVHELDVMLGGS
jgi:hypothetical protein